jgi:hypothetical protein
MKGQFAYSIKIGNVGMTTKFLLSGKIHCKSCLVRVRIFSTAGTFSRRPCGRRGWRHPPQGNARDPDDAGRGLSWMMAPPDKALILQRPLLDGTLRVVARGVGEDLPGPIS